MIRAERLRWRAWWRLDRTDIVWLLALTALAAVLRFGSPFFLDFLSHPGTGPPIAAWGIGHDFKYRNSVSCSDTIAPCTQFVFDELYFANDAHDDLLGVDYFDPEPPLAKLIIAVGIKAFGFNPFGWRVMSGIFGTLLIPLMYLLARQLLPIRFFAVATGVLTNFDGMTFVQSRIAMIDVFPVVLVVLAYVVFHLHLRADTPRRQRATIVITAIVLGLALGAKWISLAAYGTVVVIVLVGVATRWLRYDRVTGVVSLLSLAFLPGTVYLLSFIRYLAISHSLTGLGPAALSFSPLHLDIGRAWLELRAWHVATFEYHLNLRAPHPYYSRWYSWPVLYRPVAYYYQSQGLGSAEATGANLVAEIYNLGNPIIWWASLGALVAVIGRVVRQRTYPALFILLAFAAAWLPFSRVPRGLYLYHMFGGLPFMILAVALALTRLRSLTIVRGGALGRLGGAPFVYAYLVTVIVFFCYFYPLWTGLPLSYDSWLDHMWFPSWI